MLHRTTSDYNPPVIERIAGFTYIYRYDIQQEDPVSRKDVMGGEDSENSEDEEPIPQYSFVSVTLKGYPSRQQTIKALLKQMYSIEDELKIINDYNEVMALSEDPTSTDEYNTYIDYLTVRRAIKIKVNDDFTNNGY